MRAVTRDGEAWQWVVVHVAGNGDWRYSVYEDRAAAWKARGRVSPPGYDYRVAKIRTAGRPGDRGLWGSGPAPAGEPETAEEG
jgi:hypothetical protein